MTYVQQLQQALRNTVTCWEFCGAVYPFPYIGHTHTHRHTHTETHTLIHQSVFYTPLSLLLNNDFYNLPLEIQQTPALHSTHKHMDTHTQTHSYIHSYLHKQTFPPTTSVYTTCTCSQ